MSQPIFSEFSFFAAFPEPMNYKVRLSEEMEANFLALKEAIDRRAKIFFELSRVCYNNFCDFVSNVNLLAFKNGSNYIYIDIFDDLVARVEFYFWPSSMEVREISFLPLTPPDGTPPGGVGRGISVGSVNLSVRKEKDDRTKVSPSSGLRCGLDFHVERSVSISKYSECNSSIIGDVITLISKIEASSLHYYDEGLSKYCGTETHDAFDRYHVNVGSSALPNRDVEKMDVACSQTVRLVSKKGVSLFTKRSSARTRQLNKEMCDHARSRVQTFGTQENDGLR